MKRSTAPLKVHLDPDLAEGRVCPFPKNPFYKKPQSFSRNPRYCFEIKLVQAFTDSDLFTSLVRPLSSDVRFPAQTMIPWWKSGATTMLSTLRIPKA
ncbi:hypothetical protein TRICI_001386 [Trichomonascus ciferrii]|uniref:Uncharacterized protein n=1 Tax=Trichomonascus ciferrii TaxID=44093 RepID=A0A642V9R6_9ASCO|nr:hypothetical protein TRICI_001386 [Trichomonascus ciferrii]